MGKRKSYKNEKKGWKNDKEEKSQETKIIY